MTIGERIKQRREELGLSQEELAHRLGLSGRSSVSKAEKSGDIMTTKTISAYANALRVSTEYLMGLTDKVNSEDNALSNITAKDIIEILPKLDERDLRMIAELCGYFLETKK